MLVFALRVCYSLTTGEDEGQNGLVGYLRLPGYKILTYYSPVTCYALCIWCSIHTGAVSIH